MAEQKESSVLFSLKELMNLEEDRIRQEDDEKRKRAEAEVQARQEAERRAREQEQARRAWQSHLTRAKWLTTHGYTHLVRGGVSAAV